MSTFAPALTARLNIASTFSVYRNMETGFTAPGDGEHDPRIADLNFGVHDHAARSRHTHDFLCTENRFVKVDRLGCVFASQSRRNRVIPLGDSADKIRHDGLLILLDVRAMETGGRPAIQCA